MKLSPKEQEQLVSLMTRLYEEIRAIESDYALVIGEGDFRPRIDYFHDAVQALFSGDSKHLENGGRLGVEFLSYDVQCLRYILSMPLSPFKAKGGMDSPHSELVALDHQLVATPKRPDRKTKERLVELYQNYSVLFAALLKPQADADTHERTGDLDQDVRELSAIIQQCEKGNSSAITNLANHLEDERLRAELIAFIQNGGMKKPELIKKLIAGLKNKSKAKDKQRAKLEQAHMDYSLTQLALFENSRDMLKKMATQGMNLVGNFVEASISQTRREMGR
ncbi:MAG: hypothetical protein LW823_05760 [Rickettsiales bacterium]|jgi:hypothetical protein|nr:hypothetical protein [Rickettsiales bacterium]